MSGGSAAASGAGAAEGVDGDLANEVGALRSAAKGKGNFGFGSANAQDTSRLGRVWVDLKLEADGAAEY